MVLQHFATHPAATGPGVDGRQPATADRDRANRAEVGRRGGRTNRENPRVVGVLTAEPLKGVVHERIDAATAFSPYPLDLHRFHADLDLFPVGPVQIEDRGRGRPAYQGHEVDPQVVEHQARPAHGRDIESAPARRKTCDDQAVRTREDRAGQQTYADIQTVVLAGQVQPQVHGPEEIAKGVPGNAVEAAGGIDEQNLLMDFHPAVS